MTALEINPELVAGTAAAGPTVLPEGVYPVGTVVPEDRVELFRVNGKIYTVAKIMDPGVTFRYIRMIRKGSDADRAMAIMVGDILGDGVLDVLAEEKLEPDEFTAVMKAVEKYAMGATKRLLGN